MSDEKFIHHETYSRAGSDESTREGFFDVIEDEYGFYVFDDYAGMSIGRFDTLEAADSFARTKAGQAKD